MSELHVVSNGEKEVGSYESEDDMAGGDLGDGLGRKPGGVYEKENGSEPVFKPTSKHEEPNGTSFQWTKYRSWYDTFHKRQELEKPTAHKRLNSADAESEMSNEELKQRLQDITEEAELLRNELEVTQRQLEGKYEALKILQNRAVFDKATTHTKTLLQKMEERKKVLEKEVNALQWEIEFNQVRFKNHEQSCMEKYDSVCQENALLQETLESRESEIKHLQSENEALSQQRLEVLAMLDVKQQNVLQESVILSEVTGLELAVLGACNCDSTKSNPCPCAKAAAASRKELFQLKQELELQRKRKEEAYIIADAFRIAFEQQLKRKNEQSVRLTDVEKQNNKELARSRSRKNSKGEGSCFSKEGHKLLGQKLMDMLVSKVGCQKLETLDDPQEILNLLIDLLNDKEEALAHQRKVSYMLARTIEEQKRSVKQIKERNPAEKHSASTGCIQQFEMCCCNKVPESSLLSKNAATYSAVCTLSLPNESVCDNPVKSFLKSQTSPRTTIRERALAASLATHGTSEETKKSDDTSGEKL